MNDHRDHLKVLYHGKEGYVAACLCCDRIQVGFGTCMITGPEDMLRGLAQDLAHDLHVFRDKVDPGRKIFPYDLGSANIHLLLNHDEVGCLYNMLSQALLIHHVYGRMAMEEP